MKLVIEKMRADFALVAATRMASGAWDADDERHAGMAIRSAVDAEDRDLVHCWANWLGQLAVRDIGDRVVPPAVATVRECRNCRHFARPGRSAGYCAGRDDLAKAYGTGHPLHVLPADGGASCARFSPEVA